MDSNTKIGIKTQMKSKNIDFGWIEYNIDHKFLNSINIYHDDPETWLHSKPNTFLEIVKK